MDLARCVAEPRRSTQRMTTDPVLGGLFFPKQMPCDRLEHRVRTITGIELTEYV